jgi:hypothetical protein
MREDKCVARCSIKSIHKHTHMKPKQLFPKKLLLLTVLIMTGLSLPMTSKADPINGDERKPRKEKAIRINNSVKVFPDIIKRCMYVKSTQEKEISFNLFDMEGNLVLDYKLKKGERKTIAGLNKGDYVYVTFCDDVKTGTGKMQMR